MTAASLTTSASVRLAWGRKSPWPFPVNRPMLKIQEGAPTELSLRKVTAAVTRIGGGTHRSRHGETVLKVYSQLQPSLII